MNNSNRAAELTEVLGQRVARMQRGARLPGVRELSREFQASAATVSAALAALVALGLIRTEPGRGTFALGRERLTEPDFSWQTQALGPTRVDPERASRIGAYGNPEHLQLSWGYLAPELVPQDDLHRIAARAARSDRAWSLAPRAGIPELRRVLAADYRADPNDVLVVAGGQQGLICAMRTLGEPGATIITESPCYPGALIAAQSAGLRVASVPSDAHGILVDRLEDALERTRAKLVYLQPSHANPSGSVLSSERRDAVLALAKRTGAFIIEDDWARHLTIDGPSPEPLGATDPDGHVVSVTTLAKPVSPGLRIGAIVARGPAGERLRASRVADELCVSPMAQEIALGLLTSSAWPRHLKRLRVALGARRDTLIAATQAHLHDARIHTIPRGGIHLWIRFPAAVDTRALSTAAHASGVLVGDGRHFFPDEPPAPYLRLSFGAPTEPEIEEGVRRLAETLASHGGERE